MKIGEISISDILKIKTLGVDELEQAFPIVCQLRTHLTLGEYIALVKTMQPKGYQVLCLFENDKVVAYAGFAKQVNLYDGHHIWVDDLVTDKNKQGKGYGKLLLSHIEKLAKDNALNRVVLSSGLQREDAHGFYEKTMRYNKTSYVFKKDMH
ncbi:MAG: GNAT family N-acetyltransferase [Defluviitaleaceae bacterium]|nr:GNAT family N-acetyltransferase [Defluviitaleaceae bacterium]